MARRKGKIQPRQKDWERMHRAGDVGSDDAETSRRLPQRRVRLPGQAQDAAIFTEAAAPAVEKAPEPQEGAAPAEPIAEDLPRISGVVAQLYPRGAIVRTKEHGDLLCGLAGTFRPTPNASALAVGDEVDLSLTRETLGLIQAGEFRLDLNRVDGQILQRAPRETVLSRPEPTRGKRLDPYSSEVFEKVIAANLDQIVVVGSVSLPPLRRRLLDRFLIVAQRGDLPCLLAVNKIDLGEPDPAILADYAELGMPSLAVSAATGIGLEKLRERLAGKRSVLAGSSGAGKSSLLNALVPGLNLTTRQVRRKDQRGRHTTTSAVRYELPFGGSVIDTPGIRELGLEILPGLLPWYFPDFAPFAPQCHFKDCTHTHEPDCAVRLAVEDGRLSPRRFESYLRILESLEK